MAATREPYTEMYDDYLTMAAKAKWAAWALITALSAKNKVDDPEFALCGGTTAAGENKEFYEDLYAGDKTLNIQLTVNGFYLPFGAVIDMMIAQYDTEVMTTAGQIIRDKGLEIVRSADELRALIDQYANKVEEELDVRKP
jgi:hypothetical protein